MRRSSLAFVTTATAALMVLAGSVALAAAMAPMPSTQSKTDFSERSTAAASRDQTLAVVSAMTPPPGAAVLLLAGLLAVGRGRRKGAARRGAD